MASNNKLHHMTMKSILDQEEARKANRQRRDRRETSKRQRPKAKKSLDLIRELD